MTIAELAQRLVAENIPSDAYSLDGALRGETLCLGQSAQGWAVCYSERGLTTGLKLFQTEHDACEFFYRELKSMLDM